MNENALLRHENCPLCGTSVSDFIACYGLPQRQCPKCRSVERQRVFWRLYQSGSFGPNILDGKRILHVSPSIPEQFMFQHLVNSSITTVDIRESCHTDIQADISSMSGIAGASFDVTFLSYVFSCTLKFMEAVSELARVLNPGGLLLNFDFLHEGKTREFTDISQITKHYGVDNYKKYGIGSFRAFGIEDYQDFFSPFFATELRQANDIPTGRVIHWLKGIRR